MRRLIYSLTVLLLTTSRANAADEADLTFFETRVRPLLAKHCFECHSGTSKILQGGLRLDHAVGVAKGGDTGASIVPGKPDESRLLIAVRFTNADLQMPPAGKLSEPEIEILRRWIERGAIFPKSTKDDASGSRKQGVDLEAGRRHWAIRPLLRAPRQATPPSLTAEQPIDAYLNAALAQQKVRPAESADRRTLIRRVTFDVVGLPPSPAEVEAFVSDEAPDAYERLIERLLASPHHGERWGRYWLDLVRYCDVLESWAQTPAQAWVYRDWVVNALNEDLPYDQFVVRQFAADQLPDTTPKDIAALGFLGLSPSYWKELKLAPDVIKTVVAEEWEERITMVSGTLLGLTMGCARCHDHKFDPITTQDYYGLAGVLASVRHVPRPMLSASDAERVVAAKKEVTQLEAEAKKIREQAAATAATDANKSAELKSKADATLTRVAEIKASTPHYHDPLAYAVEDASLSVLPDGPNRTKIDYAVGKSQDIATQIRGNPANVGPSVPRRFLSVLSTAEPPRFTVGSGRREFGEAIFRDSAPLAARVIVNRVWRHHFGRGLVETPSNFGIQSTPPTHPELLDDLAARFIESGWSLKWLHRELLLSAAYRRSSSAAPEAITADPANIGLSRMSRRRLEVEAWRDAILSSTGTLEARLGGEPLELSDAKHQRRTLYGTIRRRELNDLLRLYDFPDPTGHSPARLETTTPLQQLFVLNSAFIGQQAQALVARVRAAHPSDVPAQIDAAYQSLFGNLPSPTQRVRAQEFLGSSPTPEQWQQLAEVMLASNALAFVD